MREKAYGAEQSGENDSGSEGLGEIVEGLEC